MLPLTLLLLGHLRRQNGIAGRKLFAHSPSGTDRRGSGEYELPPPDHQPERQYDADGNELRRKLD